MNFQFIQQNSLFYFLSLSFLLSISLIGIDSIEYERIPLKVFLELLFHFTREVSELPSCSALVKHCVFKVFCSWSFCLYFNWL